jgi:hypothetical protein
MHASNLPFLVPALVPLIFGSCASQRPPGRVLSLSGCVVEPKPRPGPGSGPGDVPRASSTAGTGDFVEHYLFFDQSYPSKDYDTVQFEFKLLDGDTLRVGPPRMKKGDDYWDLQGPYSYTIQFKEKDSYTFAVSMLRDKAPFKTRDGADYLYIGHPGIPSYARSRMKVGHLSRLQPVYKGDEPIGALELAFEAFAVPTGLTLLDDRLRLRPSWQSKYKDQGLIACVRPRAKEFDDDKYGSYHRLDYEVIQETDKTYIIEFDLDLGGDVFLAPLDDVRGADPIFLKDGIGTVRLSHEHRTVWQNRTLMTVIFPNGKKTTFKTGSPALRMSGQAITPQLKHLGTRVPPDSIEDDEPWDVVAVQLDGVGTPAGFLIIAADLKLQPAWTIEN